MNTIYFDNSATTPLSDEVKAAMLSSMENYGNPSSLHSLGFSAEKGLKEARQNLAASLGLRNLKDGEIVFTSCGSEANNLALFGVAYAKKRRLGMKILITDSEHPSLENAAKRLGDDGFSVVRIRTVGGVLDMEQIRTEADNSVLLASFMLVNNETGAMYDVAEAFKIIKRANPDAVTHCDAVQGFLKTSFTPKTLSADLVTISAHKIHGPKGVGALYISPDIIKTKKLIPWLVGGGQEFGFRSGTENTLGIAGFGEAVKCGFATLSADISKTEALRDYIIENLPTEIKVNMPVGARAPHIINCTLPQIKSETMLHFLSSRGICISSGSACSSHSHEPSRALLSFGLDSFSADCSIRISLSPRNTKEEADALLLALTEGISQLIKIRK